MESGGVSGVFLRKWLIPSKVEIPVAWKLPPRRYIETEIPTEISTIYVNYLAAL